MNHLRTTTAHDTNNALIEHLFLNDSKLHIQFTDNWTMSDRDGSDFMKRHGYEVLSDSIAAYLDGKCTKHRYLHSRVANEQDGVSTMNGNDCECLRQITTAKTSGAKHVMVLRAVRRKVLSQTRPLRTQKSPSSRRRSARKWSQPKTQRRSKNAQA